MEYFENAQIIMLPSNKTNCLLYLSTDVIPNLLSNWRGEPQELYIISNDNIEEGDWYLNQDNKAFRSTGKLNKEAFIHCRKIIASYPPLTHKGICECFATTFEGCSQCIEQTPTLSKEFINYYIEEFNKGNVFFKILVEYEEYLTNGWIPSYNNPDNHNLDEPAEIDYRVKVNPEDYTITIKNIIMKEETKVNLIDMLGVEKATNAFKQIEESVKQTKIEEERKENKIKRILQAMIPKGYLLNGEYYSGYKDKDKHIVGMWNREESSFLCITLNDDDFFVEKLPYFSDVPDTNPDSFIPFQLIDKPK